MKSVGTRVGEQVATVTIWTIAIFLLGTPLGLWVRLFWLDWVLQVCAR